MTAANSDEDFFVLEETDNRVEDSMNLSLDRSKTFLYVILD